MWPLWEMLGKFQGFSSESAKNELRKLWAPRRITEEGGKSHEDDQSENQASLTQRTSGR